MEHVMLSNMGSELCPFLSKDKTNPALTQRYTFADTETLIDDMAKLGWGVTDCKQQRANKRSNVRSFHMLSFQNPDIYLTNDAGEIEAFPRIVVQNSHDGFHSFKFMCGIFRLVCSNGLVIADAEFSSFSIRHINYDFEELRKIVAQSIDMVRTKVAVINDMKGRNLTLKEKNSLAMQALAIRKGVEVEELKVSDEDLAGILEPVRKEDEGDNLWNVFNVLQEKVMKGTFTLGKTKTGKSRKARPITGAAKDIEVNQALFFAATEYLQAA